MNAISHTESRLDEAPLSQVNKTNLPKYQNCATTKKNKKKAVGLTKDKEVIELVSKAPLVVKKENFNKNGKKRGKKDESTSVEPVSASKNKQKQRNFELQ